MITWTPYLEAVKDDKKIGKVELPEKTSSVLPRVGEVVIFSGLESLTDIGLIHYETGTLRVTDVHHSIGEDGTDHIGVYIDVRASYDAQKTTAKASEWGIEEWIPYNI
ncbi:hypothetical protein [Enteractinococcus coprophilus]|uniref:hypothetical protein n=1 Tax=Enteractinococcus coprophilus TaxID=1027633 RepID=UPI003661A2EE